VGEVFTPQQLAEIEAYHWPRYIWSAVAEPLYVVTTLLTLRFLVRPLYRLAERVGAGVSARSRVLMRMWGSPNWAGPMLFVGALYALGLLLNLPADLYFDFFHERAYGLSTESFGRYAIDWLKGAAIGGVCIGALAFGLFAVARRLRRWWLVLGVVAGTLLVASAAIDPYRSRVYFDQKPLPPGELREAISALMAKAQIDFREVVVEQTSVSTVRVQAYFAGQGPTRTIVLNDALLAAFQPDEVLAAVAHEAGHVHESRWPALLASVVVLIGFLYLIHRLFLTAARRRWMGVERYADVRLLPAIMLMFFLGHLAFTPVSAAVSRERERDADRYAIALTDDPAAFGRMLTAAARVNKMTPTPPR
jgi:STE24 endopeptidase